MEKLIIVDRVLGQNAKITTVDGTDKNRIKNYEIETYSMVELAKRIVKRAKEDKFNKVYVDANTINIGLIDALINEFEKVNYTYTPKTGEVKDNVTISLGGGCTLTGGTLHWAKLLSVKEEF